MNTEFYSTSAQGRSSHRLLLSSSALLSHLFSYLMVTGPDSSVWCSCQWCLGSRESMENGCSRWERMCGIKVNQRYLWKTTCQTIHENTKYVLAMWWQCNSCVVKCGLNLIISFVQFGFCTQLAEHTDLFPRRFKAFIAAGVTCFKHTWNHRIN